MNSEGEKFTVVRDGLKINGIQYVRDENSKCPAIIMSHGFTGNYLGFEYFARRFYDDGYAVFVFNFCGGGSRDEYDGKSDGKSTDMTISTEIADLCTVFEYAKSQQFVDTSKIYLLGESQGGFVSGLTAAKLDEQICKLIMIFPAICIPDHARGGRLAGSHYDPMNPPDEMVVERTTIGKKLHDDVYSMNPYEELSKYDGDVLIIHGIEDGVVNPAYSYLAKCGYREGQCTLLYVRDMDHGMDDGLRDSFFTAMRYFISGKKELFSFRIIITHAEAEEIDGELHNDVYFTGYCESDIFKGTITGGVDHQVYRGSEDASMNAEYTFTGIDSDGKKCTLSVINKSDGHDWRPEIRTDSEALSWINDAELYAVLEHSKTGPTVRIFVHK